MDPEDHKELHEAIEKGDMERVRSLLQSRAEEKYFLNEDTSALYAALSNEQYAIAAHLMHIGATVLDSEIDDVYDLEIDLTRVNYLLLPYNKKSDKSCIFRLISVSQSPQKLDGERLEAVISMLEELFKSEIIKLLMMVLETVPFDIFYDFEREHVNRLHRLEVEEMEIYGLTLSNAKEIFIGAKDLVSGFTQKRAKVYGVLAEELCHLAMTTQFENGAKAYREEQTKLSEDFWNIIRAVESLADRSCHIESSIKNIFSCYDVEKWECELIARVPHIIGIYGEETGRTILMETPELSSLLSFYEKNVLPKVRDYTNPLLNTKSHRLMERLMKRNDFISFKEKKTPPLKESFSFKEYLEDFPSFPEEADFERKGISVLTTNCTKLCTLHVYHELKRKYEDQLKKKALFFSRNCLERKRDKIVNALKGYVWEYLIIVMDNKELNLWRFNIHFLDYFNEFLIKGMEIIIITSSQSIDQKFNFQKAVNYKWDDLTDEYKSNLQLITYIFKGEEEAIYVRKEIFPKVFNEDNMSIMRIISEVIEVEDGKELFSQGYIPETYIQRVFTAMTVDKKLFESLPSDTSIFLSGFCEKDFEEGLINKIQVQRLVKSVDEIQEDKSVFIISDCEAMAFVDLVRKNPREKTLWLHHVEKEFILRNSSSTGDEFKQYMKEVKFSENEILDFLKRKRILVISDNPGCGKSTVVSNLINTVRRDRFNSWVWRIDFNKFSNGEKDPLSLANLNSSSDEEKVMDHLCQMLRLNGGLEKYLFRKFSLGAGRCFIFFDGFDEIPSDYMSSALKLLFFLKENTAVKLIITTRKHHQEKLEGLLDTYSHQLVPLSKEDQKGFMDKLWKSKLKDPNGKGPFQISKTEVTEKIEKIILESKNGKGRVEYEDLMLELQRVDLEKNLDSIISDIEKLDFTKFADYILNKSSLDKETLEFIGIPLHLYMIGDIYFNDNFNVEIQSEIYSLYTQFIEQKILIYLEEKENWEKKSKLKEKMVKNTRKDAFRIHINFSIKVIDEEKICLASEIEDEDDLELCVGLGVVFVHGGEIRFLHLTFAEFFKAESVRQNMQKEAFINVISHDNYKVVRRFLSSSLKTKNFENITEVCSEKGSLINIMERVDKYIPLNFFDISSDMLFRVNIMKKLLVKFEEIVEPGLVSMFIEEVESKLVILSGAGVYLTTRMIRDLMNRNFKLYSDILFGFVRFAEAADEVISVLNECISVGSDGGLGNDLCERKKRRKKIREEEDARISELLSLITQPIIDFSQGNLFSNALRNEKAEIFAHFLKFLRDCLGKEQFFEEIFDCAEYRAEMLMFIHNGRSNRVCSLIRAMRYVFGNEVKFLFDDDLKFTAIRVALLDGENDKSSNSFEEMIVLFQDCFGSEKLNEIFLSVQSRSCYIIHCLIDSCSRGNIEKRLNFIRKVLDDDHKMKQFLMMKEGELSNIFHLAAKKSEMHLDDLIRICDPYLGKDIIKDMLISNDDYGDNVIHILLRNNSWETCMKNLNLIKEIIGDELFKWMLKSNNRHNGKIFNSAAIQTEMNLDDLFEVCDPCLGKDEIKQMLHSNDEDGYNVIHILLANNSCEKYRNNLNRIKEIIGDQLFKEILKSRNNKLENILHFAAKNRYGIEFSLLGSYLCVSDIAGLLKSRDEVDQTALHKAAAWELSKTTALIDFAYEWLVSDRRDFEGFILAEDKDRNTFLHLLGKFCFSCGFDLVPNIINSLKGKLSPKDYKKLMKVRNKEEKTFLQMDGRWMKEAMTRFKVILEKDLFEELLLKDEMEEIILKMKYLKID